MSFQQLLNQHSYLLLALVVLALGALIAWRFLPVRGVVAFSAFLIVGLLVAFLVLRTGDSSVASIDEVEATIAGGKPTLIEFYSDF